MSKRNIAYIKPQDPSFLVKLKQQIGYKEGPTIDTKRQRIEDEEHSDNEAGAAEQCYKEDEKPQVVVLRPGIDLSAEEAAREEQRIAAEKQNAPADLSKPIIFKKKTQNPSEATTKSDNKTPATTAAKITKKKNQLPAAAAKATAKLSFDPEADEEEED